MTDNTMTPNSIENEYMDITTKNAWTHVFQEIGRDCSVYPYTYLEAKRPENKPLNRYRDVNPYDHSRIILKRSEKDYINANLVTMERANRKYILTQGPLIGTAGHFWLMVWEQQSRAILMLNKIMEKNEIKCYQYWPDVIGENHKVTFPDVKLAVEQISSEDFAYYTTRVFRLTDLESEESREVIQFHYTTWPDFGVPSSPMAFLNFLNKVRSMGVLEPEAGPAVVHCSAGIGRSGTFCLVDSCLVVIEKEGIESVNIQQILREMRRHRMGLIQTPDQLRFSYQAIIQGAKRLDPNWVEPIKEESIYSSVAEDEDAPPPLPPPRGESLATNPPARPLPAIPASASMGELFIHGEDSSSDSSLSDDGDVSSSLFHHDHSDDDLNTTVIETSASPDKSVEGGLRQRKNAELADRVAGIRKRAHEAERWQALKRLKTEGFPQTDPRED